MSSNATSVPALERSVSAEIPTPPSPVPFSRDMSEVFTGKSTPVEEPLLSEENQRLTTLPIRYPEIWDMYLKQLASVWVPTEVDLSKDMMDWQTLSADEQFFIKHILAFFAASDGIVNVNLVERFMNDVKITEAQYAYRFQAMMEDIHAHMYSLMIETYITDPEEKDRLLNAIETIPCIRRKADWCYRWIESNDSFASRLIGFACVEGIQFSGSFAAIFWLKSRNILPGLVMSNEFISRDEGMHRDFACLLYSMLNEKLSEKRVHEIVSEAVEIEKEFITESIPCRLIGMNSDLMCEYIEFVADHLVVQLGYRKIYNKKNPFAFMETISLQNKGNFFENRLSEYQNPHVLAEDKGFDLDDEF